MFAKTIIDSDAFLDMPVTSQLLYFHLSMRADDDGFINKPKSIMRMCGCKDDDIKLLFAKKFVIPFETGIVVIKHWKIHNYIRKDTYTETKYKDEKALLELDENNAYRQLSAPQLQGCDEVVTGTSTQVRLGKDRLGKESIEEDKADKPPRAKRFTPPTIEEVKAYCKEKGYSINPETFWFHYDSKGWFVGNKKMTSWKSAVSGWQAREKSAPKKGKALASDQQDYGDPTDFYK